MILYLSSVSIIAASWFTHIHIRSRGLSCELAKFFPEIPTTQHHPAVLEMIRMVAQNAHAEGIWAGICGELGADLELTEQFLQMGIDELSVSPGRILPIRKIVRESECGSFPKLQDDVHHKNHPASDSVGQSQVYTGSDHWFRY